MHHKYGSYPKNQFHDYKKRMHSLVHWLLIYAENEDKSYVNNYFQIVQERINGLNELLDFPVQIIEIMSFIESAKIELNKDDYCHNKYRKIIFDVHELIDRIPEGD